MKGGLGACYSGALYFILFIDIPYFILTRRELEEDHKNTKAINKYDSHFSVGLISFNKYLRCYT